MDILKNWAGGNDCFLGLDCGWIWGELQGGIRSRRWLLLSDFDSERKETGKTYQKFISCQGTWENSVTHREHDIQEQNSFL